jgi:hypothetical protein
MDKITVTEELRRVAALIDSESVSRSQFGAHATISTAAVEQTFGTWNEAILAAGLWPLPQGGVPRNEVRRRERVKSPPTLGRGTGRISDDELLDELLRLARELERRPSGDQVAARGRFSPSVH